MLDDDEFAALEALYSVGIRAVKDFRQTHGVTLDQVDRPLCFRSMLDAYEAITALREPNPDAVMHHQLSLYGPPCAQCSKPLRTPKAKHCAACGAVR
jgi:hypothetical protein